MLKNAQCDHVITDPGITKIYLISITIIKLLILVYFYNKSHIFTC